MIKLSWLKKNERSCHLLILLALGAISTPISLFENDVGDDDGDGDIILAFSAFELLKRV